MAKGSLFWGKGSGKLGETVLYRANGQQITRTYVANPNNPQSDPQMVRRASFAISANAFKRSNLHFFPLDRKLTDYAKFIRENVNIDAVPYWVSREENAIAKVKGIIPLENYILANGGMEDAQRQASITGSQESLFTARIDLFKVSASKIDFSKYADYFGEDEETAEVPALVIYQDLARIAKVDTNIHPVLVFGRICKADGLGIEKSDFLFLNEINYLEYYIEQLAGKLITLTKDSETGVISMASQYVEFGDDFNSKLSISLNFGVQEYTIFVTSDFSNTNVKYGELLTRFVATFDVKRVGGIDCSPLQLNIDNMTSVPTEWKEARKVIADGSIGSIDKEYIANWKALSAETDDFVLKRLGL